MVEKVVERAVDRAVEREFHTVFDKLREAINAQEPLHQSESRQAAKDTDVAAKDTDVAAALLLTDLAAATSTGTTTATSVGNTELLVAMSIAAKDTDVSAMLVPVTDVSATTDDCTGDGQNQVLAVCLVARSQWVLTYINLEEWTIEIYDSLAHKTPKKPDNCLSSFEGMRTLLPLILDEAGYFKRSSSRRRIDPFQSQRIPPKKVPKQEDADSCGIWTLYFAERIVSGMAINVDLQQKYINGLSKPYALQIFTNSDSIEEVEQ
ncbi:hypothetical protein Dimus_006469 [Dionaea muscipula]